MRRTTPSSQAAPALLSYSPTASGKGSKAAGNRAAGLPLALLLCTALALPACSAAGPSANAINAAARAPAGATKAPPFDVVALDAATADRLAADAPASFSDAFEPGRPIKITKSGAGAGALAMRSDNVMPGGGAPNLTIGIGDTVVVTIFEAASGGLFSGDPGAVGGASKSVAMPPQPVTRAGTISVPYVGAVKAAGRTPEEVAAAIQAGLKDKAIEPQVVVTLTGATSTFITLTGDVKSPGRVPLNLAGDRLLDVIAAAGGSEAPSYDSFVRLTRNGRAVTAPLAGIVRDPAQNIYLRPGDQVYVFTDPQSFSAFGAVGGNRTYTFESDHLTLIEAVGRAGGLEDSRANAAGVFVFRIENPDSYAAIRPGNKRPPNATAAGVPVVYRIDLKDPKGFFAAQRFMMRDNDIIYVSNSPSADLQKFFGILGGSLGAATSTKGAALAL